MEVKVSVVRKVDDCRRIGCGFVVYLPERVGKIISESSYLQFIRICERINASYVEVSWISFFTVFAEIRKAQRNTFICDRILGSPQHVTESLQRD